MIEDIKEKIDKSKEVHRYNITSSREWFENLLTYITNLQQENKQLKEKLKWYEKENKHNQEIIVKDTNILTELEEWFKKEKQIAEKNIIESKKWLEIEEEKEHAKSDIHTGKIIRRYMQYGLNKIQELKEKYK